MPTAPDLSAVQLLSQSELLLPVAPLTLPAPGELFVTSEVGINFSLLTQRCPAPLRGI